MTPTWIFAHLAAGPEAMNDLGVQEGFRKHWEQLAPETFWDVACVVDTYRMSMMRSDKLFHLPDLCPLPIVDELLSPSRGILLWHHQLENLHRPFAGRCAGVSGGSRERTPCGPFLRHARAGGDYRRKRGE